MIRKLTPLLAVALLSALLLAAIAASTASAFVYIVNETRLVGEAGIEGTGEGTAKLESTYLGVKAAVQCKKTTFSGALEEAGKGKLTAELTECKLVDATEKEFAGCKIAEPVVAKLAGTLVGKEEVEAHEPIEEKLSPKEGTEFTKIEITGCLEAGKYTITGSDDCLLPGGEEEAKEHEFQCTASGSKLKLGAEKANFIETKKYKLKSGSAFAGTIPPTISFYWRIEAAVLGNGMTKQLKTVGLKGTSNLKIAGTAKGTKFEFECNTFKPQSEKNIRGVFEPIRPSYMALNFEISGCTENWTPAGCSLAESIKSPLNTVGYLYEGILASNTAEKKYLIGFQPGGASENSLFNIKFSNIAACGALKGATVEAARGPRPRIGLLGEMLAQEVPKQEIRFGEPPGYFGGARWVTGVVRPAGLRVAEGGTETSSEIVVTGTLVAELETAESWRPI